MLNPFFLNGSRTEQGLMQDLINESIRMYGVNVYYLPRQYVTEKTIIKEVIESKFSKAYPLEAYVNSYEGYEGQGTILSKFGIQELDDLSLIISQERFSSYISPLIKNLPDVKLSTRPKEGDLIYFPLGDKLFEIKYVEHEKPFYQLRKNYVYELKCELFRYEDEIIDTSIDFIDNNTQDVGYSQILTLVGVGSTANATTNIVNGGVKYVEITNRGSGYSNSPEVKFSASPEFNGTAVGIASMIGGIVDLCEPNSSLLRIQSVELSNPGYGYTVAPKVIFVGGGGKGATAKSYIGNGVIGIITVTNGGQNYLYPPSLSFTPSPIGGQTPSGFVKIENGMVKEITITNAGFGYTIAPTITIGNPIMIGSGSYILKEKISGSSSGATAIVKSWNIVSKKLEIFSMTGKFENGEIITGMESGAQYAVNITSPITTPGNNTDKLINDIYDMNDVYAQNKQIQIEANDIVDFSEINPFGIV
jgi:hypothetical protein